MAASFSALWAVLFLWQDVCMVNLAKVRRAHFVGVGGIGISAVARLMSIQGKIVSGSDIASSLVTDELKKCGVKIYIGHKAKNIKKGIDLVVFTIAIAKDNPEFLKAQKLKIPTLSYPQMLGIISKNFYTIAVSGTHGKTTTTAMIGKILLDSGLDPTVIVGSFLKDAKSNLIVGQSRFLVIEACEYRRSFLNLRPNILVITNIDNDHLDYYKGIKDIQSAFWELASKMGTKDYLVCDTASKTTKEILTKKPRVQVISYSIQKNLPTLNVIGKHNILNAKAAICVAKILKINLNKARESLKNFSGTWRRIEFKGKTKKDALVYDDYGHHPTEIKATLAALRGKFPNKKIFVVFQPHLYSRTKILFKDFCQSFKDANKIIITDIYAAREKYDAAIHSRDLAREMAKKQDVAYINKFLDIKNLLNRETDNNSLILTIGAGNVYKIAESLIP